MILSSLAGIRQFFGRHAVSRRTRDRSFQTETLESRELLAATAVQAFHRSGQTFLTWTEDGAVVGEKYNVYRATSPLTTSNLASVQKLTSKWGPLDDNTSVHSRVAPGTGVPANFVIQDLGTPLAANKGLFVYTTPAGQTGSWYYAVTQVTNGVESLTLTAGSNSLSSAVAEVVATPQPVLTVSNTSGKGRIYTQYMDYANWNPTFQGYAYNYSVALPDNYDPSVSWPVRLMPHAYGERFRMEPSAEFAWPCIELFVDDSGGGASGSHFQTWWYGFAADHNYLTGGAIPTAGRIENFTEQRVLKAIDEVTANFNVDPLRTHAQGNSMGASGSLALGMRYANVFSGVYCSEPMTNYEASPGFQNDFSALWGTQASNLPIVNKGVYAGPLAKYDGLGVYDWMNHQAQLSSRRGEPMAFLMVGHGKVDDTIDWATQGRPFIAALNAGNAGHTAEQRGNWDHNWMGFDFALNSMFSPTGGGLSNWAYPRNVSFPGITRASGSGPEVPGTTGIDFYNMQFEWSVPWNHFHADVVDTSELYEITVRSTSGQQLADVTPERVQGFKPTPGTRISWTNTNNSTGQIAQSGVLTVDAAGQVTLPQVIIGTNTGNRLSLTVQAGPPVLTGPAAVTVSMTPQITWQSTPNTTSYEVMVRNLSTGQQSVRTIVNALSFTPETPLGIGRYRVRVRSRLSNGVISDWSNTLDFRINTAPVIDAIPAVSYVDKPTVSWADLPGAVRYELRLSNLTTGQNDLVVRNDITSNSWQFESTLGLGAYRFLVRGIDAAGIVGLWSEARRFNNAAPVSVTYTDLSTFVARPGFTWLPLSGAAYYEIAVRDRTTGVLIAGGSNIAPTSWTPDADLAKGNYRWQVRGFSGTGITGAWSARRDLNVGGKPVLQPLPLTMTNRTPTFNWSSVGGVASYEFRIANAADNRVVLNVKDITSNSFTPLADLQPLTYRIWVRAISTTGVISEWSTSLTLTITSLNVPVAPLLDPASPVVVALSPDSAEKRNEAVAMVESNRRAIDDAAADPHADVPAAQKVVFDPDQSSDIDRLMMEWALQGQSV